MFDLPGHEWFRPRLGGPDAAARADAAAAASLAGAMDLLPALEAMARDDDAPYALTWGGVARVGEVRFAALAALGRLYARLRRPPPPEPFVVRRAMAAAEASGDLHEAMAALDARACAAVQQAAEADLDARCRPRPADREAVLAYRVLQRLGAVAYERQALDPRTFTTPLQEAVRASQLASPRRRPHVRVASAYAPERLLGFVLPPAPGAADGRWAVDFSEVFEAQDAEEVAIAALRRLAEGAAAAEGLAAVAAALRPRFAAEVVREGGA